MKVTPLKVSIFQTSVGAICCIITSEYILWLHLINPIEKVNVFIASCNESIYDFNSVIVASLFQTGRNNLCKNKVLWIKTIVFLIL